MWRGAKTTEAQLIGRGGTETLRRNCSKVLVVFYFTTLLLYYFTTLLRGGTETLRRDCSKALSLLRYLLYEYKSTNTDSEETARRPGPVGNRVRSCLARNSLWYSKKKLKKLKKNNLASLGTPSGTPFTCFASTKAQILTQVQERRPSACLALTHAYVTCFTSTKMQILTQQEERRQR
jgi:hypothetical protein